MSNYISEAQAMDDNADTTPCSKHSSKHKKDPLAWMGDPDEDVSTFGMDTYGNGNMESD